MLIDRIPSSVDIIDLWCSRTIRSQFRLFNFMKNLNGIIYDFGKNWNLSSLFCVLFMFVPLFLSKSDCLPLASLGSSQITSVSKKDKRKTWKRRRKEKENVDIYLIEWLYMNYLIWKDHRKPSCMNHCIVVTLSIRNCHVCSSPRE